MPDATEPDDELSSLVRTYLRRITGQSPPDELEHSAMTASLSDRQRRVSLGTMIGGAAVMVAGIGIAFAALAFHQAPGAGAPATGVAPTASGQTLTGPSATPAQLPTARISDITLAGALNGKLGGIQTDCAPQGRNVEGGTDSAHVWATGTLEGHTVHVQIYDPSSWGTSEGGYHVFVGEEVSSTDQNTPTSWAVQSPMGISAFNVKSGATFDVTLQPYPAGAYSPAIARTSTLIVKGTVVC